MLVIATKNSTTKDVVPTAKAVVDAVAKAKKKIQEEVASTTTGETEIKKIPKKEDTAVGKEKVETKARAKAEEETATAKSKSSMSEYEGYTQVHNATFSAQMAGEWVYQPNHVSVLFQKHLQCLDRERQGNCHDPTSWERTNDTAKISRHNSLLKNAVSNSVGILDASDPWVWQSNLSNYKVISYNRDETNRCCERIRTILLNRKIFLIGDSLTRQWGQVMRCEIMNILGKSSKEADQTSFPLMMHVGFKNNLIKKYEYLFRQTTERD